MLCSASGQAGQVGQLASAEGSERAQGARRRVDVVVRCPRTGKLQQATVRTSYYSCSADVISRSSNTRKR